MKIHFEKDKFEPCVAGVMSIEHKTIKEDSLKSLKEIMDLTLKTLGEDFWAEVKKQKKKFKKK